MEAKSFGIIYKITNSLNCKIYIGLTRRSIKIRFAEHVRYRFSSAISQAIQKCGEEVFEIVPIDHAATLTELKRKEKDWIATLNCRAPLGYNICSGGGTPPEIPANLGKPNPEVAERNRARRGIPLSDRHLAALRKLHAAKKGIPSGYKYSEESRAKMSAAAARRVFSEEHRRKLGEATKQRHAERRLIKAAELALNPPLPKQPKPRKQRVVSPEGRAKYSAAHKGEKAYWFGKNLTEEAKRKIGDANRGRFLGEKSPCFGKRHSKEVQDRITAQNIGRKVSAETRAKQSAVRKGRKHSEEHRKNLSLSQRGKHEYLKGRVVSEETKRRMSEARTGLRKINGIWIKPSPQLQAD